MKLITEDFDKAVSAHWSASTCLIAQMMMRELNTKLDPLGCSSMERMTLADGTKVPLTRDMQDVQQAFDYAYKNLDPRVAGTYMASGSPEEHESDLFFLRAMLPIEFES